MKSLYKELDPKIRIRIKLVFLISIVTTFLELLSIISIFPIIKSVFDPKFISEKLNFLDLRISDQEIIFFVMSGVILIFLVKNIAIYYFSVLQSKFINFATVDLTSKYFKKYLDLDYSEFIKFNSSYYVRNVIENISTLFGVYLKSTITLFIEILLVSILLFILFNLDFVSTLYFLLLFSFLGLFVYYIFRNKLTNYGSHINEYYAKKLINLNQGFNSFKEINVSNTNDYFLRGFTANLRNIALISFKVEAIQAVPRLVLEVAGITMIIIFLYINFTKSPTGNYDYFATMTLFALSGLRMLPSANRILSSVNRLRYSGPIILILENELKRFKKNSSNKNVKHDENVKIVLNEKIKIQNLSFSYDQNSNIFENLNLEFKKGSINIILGNSGFGKTTLINILLGFLKPNKGKILSDEKNIFTNISSWRSNLAFVPQEINLGDEKLKSNIAFGENESKINEKKVYEVLDVVEMKKFVENLPKKLDTTTGEKGFKISGGQRQRIAIARCLYKDKDVIILDEATSSLDKNTEQAIMQKIKERCKNKTIIFVTHRNSLTRFADKVFSFNQKGKIVEKIND